MTNTQAQDTQQLTILGPNLADQSKGDFHVHASGCRDIARYPGRVQRDAMVATFGRRIDVVTTVYPPSDFDYDDSVPTEVAPYAGSFYFLPCVRV